MPRAKPKKPHSKKSSTKKVAAKLLIFQGSPAPLPLLSGQSPVSGISKCGDAMEVIIFNYTSILLSVLPKLTANNAIAARYDNKHLENGSVKFSVARH
jgi:hypothetical protein